MPGDAMAEQIRALPIDMQLALMQAAQTQHTVEPAAPVQSAPQPAAPAETQPSWWSNWRDWFTPMPGPMM